MKRNTSNKTLDTIYISNCKNDGIEPNNSIIYKFQTNRLDLDLDFLTQQHLECILNTLRSSSQRDCFEFIRVSWNESNNACEYIDKNIIRSTNRKSTNAKDTLFLKHLRHVQQREMKKGLNLEGRFPKMAQELNLTTGLNFFKIVTHACIGNRLRVLEISGIKLSTHATSLIAKALLQCTHCLNVIGFKNTYMGDDAFDRLIPTLKTCTCLTQIQFAGCNLTDRGGGFLLSLIRVIQSKYISQIWTNGLRYGVSQTSFCLKSIDVHDNYFGDETAKGFASVLKDDQTIEALNFFKNSFGVEGIHSILELIRNNKNIKFVDLSNNYGISEYFNAPISPDVSLNSYFNTSNCIFWRKKKKKSESDTSSAISSKSGIKGDLITLQKENELLHQENEKLKNLVEQYRSQLNLRSSNSLIIQELEKSMDEMFEILSTIKQKEEKTENKEQNEELKEERNEEPKEQNGAHQEGDENNPIVSRLKEMWK